MLYGPIFCTQNMGAIKKKNLENLLLRQFAELLKKKIIFFVTLLYYLKRYQSILKKNVSFLPTTMHRFASKNMAICKN